MRNFIAGITITVAAALVAAVAAATVSHGIQAGSSSDDPGIYFHT